jgi:hypothetical protein
MHKWKVLVIALVSVMIVAGVALAGATAGVYQVPWDAYSSGGEQMESSSYKMTSTAGQEMVGGTSGDTYQIGAGFWTTTGEDPFTVFLPLLFRDY